MKLDGAHRKIVADALEEIANNLEGFCRRNPVKGGLENLERRVAVLRALAVGFRDEAGLDDLQVNEYQLQGGTAGTVTDVVLRRMPQRKGPDKWAIYEGLNCLNRDGKWEFEPRPSRRDDEYIRRCRFDSAEEALSFWESSGFTSRFSHYDQK